MLQENDAQAIFASVFATPQSRQLGVAFFDMDDESLFVADFLDNAQVQDLLERIDPQVIITNSRQNASWLLAPDTNRGAPGLLRKLHFGRSVEFVLDNSIHKLQMLAIDDLGIDPDMKPQDITLRLMSAVDLQAAYIPACGGLLSYLLKNRIIQQLDDTASPPSIRSIQLIPSNQVMLVDRATLLGLHVFVDESPVVLTADRHKEGHSIFSLLDQTQTSSGSRLLRRWLTFPSADLAELDVRHAHVEYLHAPAHHDLLGELRGLLAGIHDLPRLLTRFRTVRAKVHDWIAFQETLQHIIGIHSLLTPRKEVPLFTRLCQAWDARIIDLNHDLREIVDIQESKSVGSIKIRDGVWTELDRLRSHHASLGAFLTEVAKTDLEHGSVPAALRSITYVYMPQIGYLLVGPFDPTSPLPNDIDDLEFQFRTEGNVFFKNFRCRELDESIGDLAGIISDMEASLARELVSRFLQLSDALIALSHIVSELDVYCAFARAAVDHRYVRPSLTLPNPQSPNLSPDNNSAVKRYPIDIREGRHPLYELTADAFVPNHTRMDSDRHTVHVITGPNNSGKSVYIRQVALIVYMAQVGSFVPAEAATLSICDRLFARFDSLDSNMTSLSTFQRDACAMAYILRHFTPQSLILIDEFGKGTCKEDGIALMVSLIHFLLDQPSCPKTFIVTHFHEIFSADVVGMLPLVPPPRLGYFQMQVLFQHQHEPHQIQQHFEDVVFVYRVIPGINVESLGDLCAELAGVPVSVCDRARSIKARLMQHLPIEPEKSDEQIIREAQLDDVWKLFCNLSAAQDGPTLNDMLAQLLEFLEQV